MGDFNSHKSYRPLTVLSFRINHALSGLDPRDFHITNVVLHTIVSLLSFELSRLLFADKRPAFIAALLFSVHSIHTEAIANIVGRAELLSAIFFIAALLAFTRVAK